MFIRSITAALGLSALILGLVGHAGIGGHSRPTTSASGTTAKQVFPARIELPNGFRPEGIAIKGSTAYFGSLADGDIYAASLRTGEGKVISQGPGTPSVGLKIDHRGRLFVAGGTRRERPGRRHPHRQYPGDLHVRHSSDVRQRRRAGPERSLVHRLAEAGHLQSAARSSRQAARRSPPYKRSR